MGFDRSGHHTFIFDYELERDDDVIEVEVTYCVDDDDLYLASVRHDGREIVTTPDEDNELLAYACEQVSEDMESAEADYGDYLYDMRRSDEDWDTG